jgi:hypothetical protein
VFGKVSAGVVIHRGDCTTGCANLILSKTIYRFQLYSGCIQEYIFCKRSKLPELEVLAHRSPLQVLNI